MPAWPRSVKSRSATAMTSSAGRSTLPATVIQCGWSFSTRFSPGRSLLMPAYSPLLGQLQEDQERARREVRPIGDGALERAVDDDVGDRPDRGEEHSVEERGQRVGPTQQQAHEERELDVTETQRFGLEDCRAEEREKQEQ